MYLGAPASRWSSGARRVVVVAIRRYDWRITRRVCYLFSSELQNIRMCAQSRRGRAADARTPSTNASPQCGPAGAATLISLRRLRSADGARRGPAAWQSGRSRRNAAVKPAVSPPPPPTDLSHDTAPYTRANTGKPPSKLRAQITRRRRRNAPRAFAHTSHRTLHTNRRTKRPNKNNDLASLSLASRLPARSLAARPPLAISRTVCTEELTHASRARRHPRTHTTGTPCR